MSISARIEQTIESWTELWKERMRGFLISVVDLGVQALLKAIGKSTSRILRPVIEEMEATGKVPEALKPLFEEMKAPTGEAGAAIGMLMGGSVAGGATTSILAPWFALINQVMSGKFPWQLFDPTVAFALYFRNIMTKDDLYDMMRRAGWRDDWTEAYEHFYHPRLDPGSVITAWRRDKVKYEKLFTDLKDMGWSDDRIEALKFATLVYPAPRDLIEFQAHEVFEPKMIEKYGLKDELEELERERFYEIGMPDQLIDEHWINHWVHPAWGQVLDMYHRGELSYDDVWAWFRVVEIPPYWRDKMIAISWSLPNRIETRMMARYGLVDKEWLVGHLERIGLHEDYRSIAADFMLAMGVRMDIAARYSKGYLTADEVKSEIAAFGMSEEINERLYQWIVKNTEGERVEGERDLTKAEIYAGVKKEVISWDEGLELLEDLGYDRDEAEFILKVRVGVAEGSPDTFTEFKDWTQGYRKARGLEAKVPPTELIEAGKALREAEIARKEAIDKGIKAEKLAPYEKAVSDASYRYKQLLTKWKAEGG